MEQLLCLDPLDERVVVRHFVVVFSHRRPSELYGLSCEQGLEICRELDIGGDGGLLGDGEIGAGLGSRRRPPEGVRFPLVAIRVSMDAINSKFRTCLRILLWLVFPCTRC